MARVKLTWSASGSLAAMVLLGAATVSSAPSKATTAVPPMVPPGVTLVEVVRELSTSSAQLLWVRPGDADGRTLLVSSKDQPGVSNCVGECATEFPPLLAGTGAKPFGDWTLVRRQDGAMQWAYQSQPLYTWVKEQEPSELATNVGLTETANMKLAEGPVRPGSLMPPQGWQVARFLPGKSFVGPAGIDQAIVPSAQGVALTDFQGRTLYTFRGGVNADNQACSEEAGCEIRWQPVVAPALAVPVGDFSVVTRNDGSKQWAYKQQPLYRFSGDLMAGDAHGIGVDPKWSVALLMEGFRPADVSVVTLDGYGDTMAVKGFTLYTGSAFQKYWGGRNMRDSFKIAYYKGKRLGPNGCVDAECAKEWRPFLAPADARSHGFWEPIARPDGTKQWAYKGYALYTYAGDKAPGDHFGQATYAFAKLEGTPEDIKRSQMLEQITKASGGAGVYFNIAKP
jgi:predicted lipoprotein with Yx(FWY)xxD motif